MAGALTHKFRYSFILVVFNLSFPTLQSHLLLTMVNFHGMSNSREHRIRPQHIGQSTLARCMYVMYVDDAIYGSTSFVRSFVLSFDPLFIMVSCWCNPTLLLMWSLRLDDGHSVITSHLYVPIYSTHQRKSNSTAVVQ